MSVSLTVAPAKSSGQGFGSATGQYMDLFIKYDTQTLSGYGLRILRTPKYGDAVDFVLMRYENGVSSELTAPVSSDAYRTNCTITVTVSGNKLTAGAVTDTPARTERDQVQPYVNLETEIIPNSFGGTGIQHTGTTGGGSTWLRHLAITWE